MLTISKIKDLFAGKLSDQLAYEYLIDLSKQKPSAGMIDELIAEILEVNDISLIRSIVQPLEQFGDLIDCCGTGSSGIPHYNTSTSVAFVLAAGGLKVAKFGNRSAGGSSGSFDFLESLGLPTSLPVGAIPELMEKTNIVFLYAPQFYPSLAKLSPIRKAIGGWTIFNLIGPLLNPVNPAQRVIGTTTKDAQQAVAEYLFSNAAAKYFTGGSNTQGSENRKAFIVRAHSGMDELDPASDNSILQVDCHAVQEIEQPANMTAGKYVRTDRFFTVAENAQLFKELISPSTSRAKVLTDATDVTDSKYNAFTSISTTFSAAFSSAPTSSMAISSVADIPFSYFRSLVILNAAAGFFLSGRVESLEQGQQLASELLLSGAVLAKYEQCRRLYVELI